MEVVGLRTYAVTASDFPLRLEIVAVNLPANRAIVGSVRVSRKGVLASTKTVAQTVNQAIRTISYAIAKPAEKQPVTITHTIECFFDKKAANARYEIAITAADGSSAPTTVRPPTLNPGTAHLTFQFPKEPTT